LKKEIPLVFGQNLVSIQGSMKKKSGYIKVLMNDDDINELFTGYFTDQFKTKKISIIMEDIEENTGLIERPISNGTKGFPDKTVRIS